ncbi:hypothetical protein C5167_043185 [Papaver somniferum]|uniref:Uncharacterized protein n=1 Tax=Papaver somniferum TaxID=3469 RepID=A0A4Y7L4Z0_PAPSO|nr:hypothetical protein C5167_043185 [Papaver somniferum]
MELIIVSLRFCLDTVEMKNGPWSFAGICPGTNVSKPKKGSAAAVFGLGIVSFSVIAYLNSLSNSANRCRLGKAWESSRNQVAGQY